VANVGDSTAVLAVNNPQKNQIGQHPIKAIVLTKDHKAEDPDEIKTIKGLGMFYFIFIHTSFMRGVNALVFFFVCVNFLFFKVFKELTYITGIWHGENVEQSLVPT